MRWTVAVVLRPVTFVLAIVAAVLTGNRTGSFWYGLLAFFVAMGAGAVLGALIRNRPNRAVRRAIWPAAAVGYAYLFAWVGLPAWANFFVSVIAASMTKSALAGAPRRGRATVSMRAGKWRRVVDLDELLP
jgi:hypothetical protein